jgi:hypothetical protein
MPKKTKKKEQAPAFEMVWEDKFVKHEVVPADQLLANPNNFRIHSKAQQAALEGSLDDLQWIGAVKVNMQTGNIFDGHLRVTLALRKGERVGVPVDYYDLTPEQEAQALLSIDPISAMATTDRENMSALMEMITSENEQTKAFLNELAQREIAIKMPTSEAQKQPKLPSEQYIEIYCSKEDLKEFNELTKEWQERDGVTVNIS